MGAEKVRSRPGRWMRLPSLARSTSRRAAAVRRPAMVVGLEHLRPSGLDPELHRTPWWISPAHRRASRGGLQVGILAGALASAAAIDRRDRLSLSDCGAVAARLTDYGVRPGPFPAARTASALGMNRSAALGRLTYLSRMGAIGSGPGKRSQPWRLSSCMISEVRARAQLALGRERDAVADGVGAVGEPFGHLLDLAAPEAVGRPLHGVAVGCGKHHAGPRPEVVSAPLRPWRSRSAEITWMPSTKQSPNWRDSASPGWSEGTWWRVGSSSSTTQMRRASSWSSESMALTAILSQVEMRPRRLGTGVLGAEEAQQN